MTGFGPTAQRVLASMPIERQPLVAAVWRTGDALEAAHDGALSPPLWVLQREYENAQAALTAYDNAERRSS